MRRFWLVHYSSKKRYDMIAGPNMNLLTSWRVSSCKKLSLGSQVVRSRGYPSHWTKYFTPGPRSASSAKLALRRQTVSKVMLSQDGFNIVSFSLLTRLGRVERYAILVRVFVRRHLLLEAMETHGKLIWTSTCQRSWQT